MQRNVKQMSKNLGNCRPFSYKKIKVVNVKKATGAKFYTYLTALGGKTAIVQTVTRAQLKALIFILIQREIFIVMV